MYIIFSPWNFIIQEIPIAPPQEPESADTDEIGSKEERRKKHKKIEVTDLFRSYKKQKTQSNMKEDEPIAEPESQLQPVHIKKKDKITNKGKGSLVRNFIKYFCIEKMIWFSSRWIDQIEWRQTTCWMGKAGQNENCWYKGWEMGCGDHWVNSFSKIN